MMLNMEGIPEGFGRFLTEFIISVRSANTQWMEKNLEVIYKNRKRKENLELELQHEIRVRRSEIEHELEKLATEQAGELERLKMKVERDIRNYANFLDELDTMKAQIVAAFKEAPPTVALLIHRHASELLNQMWNEENLEARKSLEGKLIDLMDSVSADVKALRESEDGSYFSPKKSLRLIKGSDID
jgi:hypothetical protein